MLRTCRISPGRAEAKGTHQQSGVLDVTKCFGIIYIVETIFFSVFKSSRKTPIFINKYVWKEKRGSCFVHTRTLI